MKARITRLCILLFISMSMACVVINNTAYAESERVTVSHAIAIAYDNSGSMYDDDHSWSNAKYSMEVLATMLDERDSLHIFTMDLDKEKAIIEGSDAITSRANAVHSIDFAKSSSTCIDASRHALSYLESLSADDADERYLIITTDGSFNDDQGESIDVAEGITRIQMIAEAAASEGITVIYLAIGNGAVEIQEEPSKGIYCRHTTSANILETMTDIANQVFGRALLPADKWDAETGKMTFDVPMQKIVVLAQGKKSTLGSLSGNAISVAGEQATVSWSRKGSEANEEPNKSLNGKVGIYDDLFPQGEYELQISQAESAAVYYMPYIDISVKLVNSDGASTTLDTTGANSIPEGTYTIGMALLDPFTKEELDSPLLEGAVFTAQIDQGGDVQTVNGGDTVQIGPDETELVAVANVPGGVRVVQQYKNLDVKPKRASLQIDVSKVPSLADVDKLGPHDELPSGQVTIKKTDGTKLNAEEWSLMTLVPQSDDGLVWDVKKSKKNLGVYIVTLKGVERNYGFFEQVMLHLFTHVGGIDASSKFVAEVDAKPSDLYGSEPAPTTLVGTFYFWVWIMIALILALIVRWITRPKLPRLSPAVDIGDGKGYKRIRGAVGYTNKWPSLGAEEASFDVSTENRKSQKVVNTLGLQTVYLVAVSAHGHGRSCKLAPQTRAEMLSMVKAKQARTRIIDANGNQNTTLTEGDVINITRMVNGMEVRCRIRLFTEE